MENWKTRKSKRFYCRQRVRKLETCLSLSCDLIVQAVEVLGGGAVHVEPPVADEVLLLEQGAVGAEERELGETGVAVVGADVERLALRLGVAVVTAVHLAVAGERGLRRNCIDGVVLPWSARDGVFQGANSTFKRMGKVHFKEQVVKRHPPAAGEPKEPPKPAPAPP